ncbi:MAG: hypothetical protein ACP6IU_08285 [Candidatus Asgardarchaeia archaeon]
MHAEQSSFLLGIFGLVIFILFFFIEINGVNLWQITAVYIGIAGDEFSFFVYCMIVFSLLVVFLPVFMYSAMTKSYKNMLYLLPWAFMLFGMEIFCFVMHLIDWYVASLSLPLLIKEEISHLLYIYALIILVTGLSIVGNEISCYFSYSKHYRKYSKKFKEYRKGRFALIVWFSLWGALIFVYILSFYIVSISYIMLNLPSWIHGWIVCIIYITPPMFSYIFTKYEELKDYTIILVSLIPAAFIYVLDRALKTVLVSFTYLFALAVIYIILRKLGHEAKRLLLWIICNFAWYVCFMIIS